MKLKDAVITVIDDLPDGIVFTGRDLQKWVGRYYEGAGRKYTDTILRVARKYCREKYECVDKAKSKYKRVAI